MVHSLVALTTPSASLRSRNNLVFGYFEDIKTINLLKNCVAIKKNRIKHINIEDFSYFCGRLIT